jgi:hypothetical protein
LAHSWPHRHQPGMIELRLVRHCILAFGIK